MADKVKVQLMHGTVEGKARDVVEVTPVRARVLARAGVARPATKPDAKAAGLDPETAATASSPASASSSSSSK